MTILYVQSKLKNVINVDNINKLISKCFKVTLIINKNKASLQKNLMIKIKKPATQQSQPNNLPRDAMEKQKLLDRIKAQIQILKKNEQQNDQSLKTLKLRVRLINSCSQLSEIRIDHLQEIFKHYCTHIFKTGKHMTFQRLEYQKIHLTMDRFFVFLKDFELTHRQIQGKDTQLVQKNTIVTFFKRMSSNSRDLTFQEFVACIEKIGIIFYDQKTQYNGKKLQRQKQRQRRIAQYRRKIKQKQENRQKSKKYKNRSLINQSEIGINKKTQNNASQEGQQKQENENDDLVKQMMNDSSIQNVNEQVQAEVQKSLRELQKLEAEQKKQKQKQKTDNKKSQLEELLELTQEQKIQYFYKLMSIDSISQYKKKMSKLNLPIFAQKQKPARPSKQRNSKQYELQTQLNPSGPYSYRVVQLKDKIQQRKRKEKERQLMSRLSKQKQQQILEKQYGKIHDKSDDGQKVGQSSKKPINKKEGPLDGQINLNRLNKLSVDQLKLKQKFNPFKFFSVDDQDSRFLSQYLVSIPKRKTESKLDMPKNHSSSVVQKLNKRVVQMQTKQKAKTKKVNQLIKKQYSSNKVVTKY